jgi:hypothetical protein
MAEGAADQFVGAQPELVAATAHEAKERSSGYYLLPLA